jgi:hypothetical protein
MPPQVPGVQEQETQVEVHTTARNMSDSAQRRPPIVTACWPPAEPW